METDNSLFATILVLQERKRQDALKASGRFTYTCADQAMGDMEKLAVLTEEVGEVARALLEKSRLVTDIKATPPALKTELIQVAAICVAWIEALNSAETEMFQRNISEWGDMLPCRCGAFLQRTSTWVRENEARTSDGSLHYLQDPCKPPASASPDNAEKVMTINEVAMKPLDDLERDGLHTDSEVHEFLNTRDLQGKARHLRRKE